MIRRLARQAISSFTAWRHRRRLARAAPELVSLAQQIEAERRKHRPVRRLIRAQREAMTARLARELSATLPDRRFHP